MEITGTTLRAYREKLALSQRDFAKAIGVSQALVSLVELGHSEPSRKLLRRLRIHSDEGRLRPTFAEFLSGARIEPRTEKSEFEVPRPLPLEPWHARIDLRDPADAGVTGRFFLSGSPAGSRAFQFTNPPSLLENDRIAAFCPIEIHRLSRDQVVLVQFRVAPQSREIRAGHAILGRAIVVRSGRDVRAQFEPAALNAPVLELSEKNVEVVMGCYFRGRLYT